MADFTTADLEGANEALNKTLTDAKALKDSLVAQHGADASTMLADVESKVTDLISSVSSMIPELPTIPNVNMQGEFAALADIDISTAAGLEQFTAQTANITSQFGTAMADKGLDPIPIFKRSISLTKNNKNIEILWASTREVYNFTQAKQIKCNIITIPPKIIDKIGSSRADAKKLTLDTVKGFLTDSSKSKFRL